MGIVRNSVVAVAAVWHHRRIHPMVMRVRILRSVPSSARRAVASVLPRNSPTGAASTWLAGDRERAEAVLRATAAGTTSRRTSSALAATAALHEPGLAPSALPSSGDSRQRHAIALVLRERGALSAARALATGSRALESFGDVVDGELALLQGEIGAPAAPPSGGSRTVHVVTNALPDVVAGYTTRTHGIASAQAARGPVSVATRLGFPVAGGRVRAPLRVTVDGVVYERRLPRRGQQGRVDVAATAEAARLVETASDARVLHAHSHHVNGTVAQVAAKALGLPMVYEVRGFLEETWVARGGDPEAEFVRLARAAETRVMLAADHVVTLSEGMRDEVVRRGVAADRITVVPNAVGSEWLSGDDDHAAARERLGIDDSLLVGTVSSINGYEGLELIGEVVAELLARGVKARGVVVGDGPALDELRVAPGAEHVTFTGRVNRESAMQWHRAIDVFAVPRLDTSVTRVVTPIKPLEAMATGSLVIASDLPALLETVPDASGGLVVTRDASAWAEAIARVLAAGEIAERGAAGRRWVEENRTWEALVDRYDEVYAAARRRLN